MKGFITSVVVLILTLVGTTSGLATHISSFNEQFNTGTTAPNWGRVSGTWNVVSPGYFFSTGIQNKWATTTFGSSIGNSTFINGDFRAMIARGTTGCDNCSNAIFIRASGAIASDGLPANFYRFAVTKQTGRFNISKRVNGTFTTLQSFTSSSAIRANQFNELRVVADGSSLKFYINGSLVSSRVDSSLSIGSVGVTFFRNTTTPDGLFVNFATFAPIQRRLTVTVGGSGNGTVSGGGISCNKGGGTCARDFNHGTQVTLLPNAASGSSFARWSGACGGTGTCRVTMDRAQAVTALFNLIPRRLTVAVSGTGTGTVGGGGGISCSKGGGTCAVSFSHGTRVGLTASPASGSRFERWSGACSGTGGCTVTMDRDQVVTAIFTQVRRLTVTASGTGNGTVNGPNGIACRKGGGTCAASLDQGARVTLTAAPASGSRFERWSGACSGTAPCQITMDRDQAVSAIFTLLKRRLTVTVNGTGNGTVSGGGISCSKGGGTCARDIDHGTRVTLSPSPTTGSKFERWSGSCSGTGGCTVTMDRDQAVTAVFTQVRRLTVTVSGTGNGTVSGGGISCSKGGGTCAANFDQGAQVTLTAAADPATSSFVGWSGGGCSGTGGCTITMNGDQAVTGIFTLLQRRLTVTAGGSGNGTVRGGGISCSKGGGTCAASFAHGTRVTVTARPAADSTFAGWSGACSGTGGCTITMDRDQAVTAIFTEITPSLGVRKIPAGFGTVTSTANGISCGSDCEEIYRFGTKVTLNAVDNGFSTFLGWSGGGCTGTGSCTITMTKDQAVAARFAANSTNFLGGDSFLVSVQQVDNIRASLLFNISARGVVKKIGDLDHGAQALALIGSVLYSLDGLDPTLRTIDLKTGKTLSTIPLVPSGNLDIEGGVGLALDPNTNKLWGLLRGPLPRANGFTQLVMIDPVSGVVTRVAELRGVFVDLTFDSSGKLYAITGNTEITQGQFIPAATIFRLDKVTGVAEIFKNLSNGATRGKPNFPNFRENETIGFGPGVGRLFHLSGQNMNANGKPKNILFEAIGLDTQRARVSIPLSGPNFYLTTGMTALPPTSANGSDVNGDGREDLLWGNFKNGQALAWLMTEEGLRDGQTFLGRVPAGWALRGVGDISGDGRADLVWRNTTNGATMVWQMTAAGRPGTISFPGAVAVFWKIKSVGDVNGDGRVDLVWRNTNNGSTMVWLMTQAGKRGGITFLGRVPLIWEIQEVADVNGDARSDLIWWNRINGRTMVWQVNSAGRRAKITFPGSGVPASNWAITAIGDMNRDGRSDFVWRDKSNGDVVIWLMTAETSVETAIGLGSVPTSWVILAVKDVNGDGWDDVVWQRTKDRLVVVWQTTGEITNGRGPATNLGASSLDFVLQP